MQSVKDFSFILTLHVLSKVATVLLPLSASLQEKSIDLLKCCKVIETVRQVLANYRADKSIFQLIFKKSWSKYNLRVFKAYLFISITCLKHSVLKISSKISYFDKYTAFVNVRHNHNLLDCAALLKDDTFSLPQSTPDVIEQYRITLFESYLIDLDQQLEHRFMRHQKGVFHLQHLVPAHFGKGDFKNTFPRAQLYRNEFFRQ